MRPAKRDLDRKDAPNRLSVSRRSSHRDHDARIDRETDGTDAKGSGSFTTRLQRKLGNREIQQLVREGAVRPPLDVAPTDDRFEREAKRVADRTVRTAVTPRQSATPTDDRSQPRLSGSRGSRQKVSGALRNELGLANGRQLPAEVRDVFESRLGADFSPVRIHTGRKANSAARAMNAAAFTIGSDIGFARGTYRPETVDGRRLLAHELTHVRQQRTRSPQRRRERDASAGIPGGKTTRRSSADVQIRRQEAEENQESASSDLVTAVDLSSLSAQQLQDRHDQIVRVLSVYPPLSPVATFLREEVGRIGVELARRRALASGRTFESVAVTRMRDFFVDNATSSDPDSCIATLNEGVRLLLDDPQQRVGSDVQTTMERLESTGNVEAKRVIEFRDDRGNVTRGVRRPHELTESVWGALIDMAGDDPGWSVFGLSLMDGYHSVTLSLDNTDPDSPTVYWSDQWSSRGGWEGYTGNALDDEITRLIQQWWDGLPQGGKHRTRVTLWRLRQDRSE